VPAEPLGAEGRAAGADVVRGRRSRRCCRGEVEGAGGPAAGEAVRRGGAPARLLHRLHDRGELAAVRGEWKSTGCRTRYYSVNDGDEDFFDLLDDTLKDKSAEATSG
jgi:hypothetical protein